MGKKFIGMPSHDEQWKGIKSKVGGNAGIIKILRDEVTIVTKKVSGLDKGAIMFFSLKSPGWEGKEWVTHHERNGIEIPSYLKELLMSDDYVPSKKGTIYRVRLVNHDKKTIYSKKEYDNFLREITNPNVEVPILLLDTIPIEVMKSLHLLWQETIRRPTSGYFGETYTLFQAPDITICD